MNTNKQREPANRRPRLRVHLIWGIVTLASVALAVGLPPSTHEYHRGYEAGYPKAIDYMQCLRDGDRRERWPPASPVIDDLVARSPVCLRR